MLSLLTRGVLILALAWAAPLAGAQTQFTYQGQLQQQGRPYSGSADYSFTLWDALAGGSQVGSTVPASGVTVAAGLFTVPLDFGSNAFAAPAPTYLQIAVRTPAWNGQGQEPPFTTLTTRQPITASPYAIQTRGIFVAADPQRVGIGTTSPFAGFGTEYPSDWKGLHVASLDDGAKAVGLLEGNDWSRLHLRSYTALTNAKNFVIDDTGGRTYFRWLNDDLSLRSTPLTLAPNGNVGIGFDASAGAPQAKLDIAGTPGTDGIRFPDGTLQTSAATSTFRAVESNLLIVRGYYDAINGSNPMGFSVVQQAPGDFLVTFTRPWASVPAVLVTSVGTGGGIGADATPIPPNISTWRVRTFNSGNGTPISASFSIMAIGVPQ